MGKKIELPNLDRLLEIYNECGRNARKAALYLGLNDQGNSIRRTFKENGIELSRRRYHIDENYFETIDSEEKAYWLGFLAADGTIRLRHGGAEKKKRGSSIVLKLAVKDEDHLKKFANIFGGDSRITYQRDYTRTRKGNESYSDNCRVSINSNKLVEDIMNKGVIPRKTWTLSAPNIDKEYFPHYIRGYFDGNGSISFEQTNGKRDESALVVKNLNLSIATVAEGIIEWFIDYFRQYGVEFSRGGKYEINLRNMRNIYSFLKIIYRDSTVCLDRKNEIAKRFMDFYEYNKETVGNKYYV